MVCEYSEICWRYWFTKYLNDIGYTDDQPPERAEIAFELDVPAHLTQTKLSKKGAVIYGGIYAEVLPIASDRDTHCPITRGQGPDKCHEYCKKKKVEERQANRTANYLKRFPNKKKRVNLSRDLQIEVWQKCKYKCFYCDRAHKHLENMGIKLVIDHYNPLALGGSPDNISNLVLACYNCNSAKGTEIWTKGCRIGFY